jgi:hypothetical protein
MALQNVTWPDGALVSEEAPTQADHEAPAGTQQGERDGERDSHSFFWLLRRASRQAQIRNPKSEIRNPSALPFHEFPERRARYMDCSLKSRQEPRPKEGPPAGGCLRRISSLPRCSHQAES